MQKNKFSVSRDAAAPWSLRAPGHQHGTARLRESTTHLLPMAEAPPRRMSARGTFEATVAGKDIAKRALADDMLPQRHAQLRLE